MALGFSDGELDIFKLNNKDDKKEETRSMLAEHIKRKDGGDPFAELLKGVKEIGRNDIYNGKQFLSCCLVRIYEQRRTPLVRISLLEC